MIQTLCTLAAVGFLILAICVAVMTYMIDNAPEFPDDDGESL